MSSPLSNFILGIIFSTGVDLVFKATTELDSIGGIFLSGGTLFVFIIINADGIIGWLRGSQDNAKANSTREKVKQEVDKDYEM